MDFDFSWPENPAPMLLWIVLLPLCGAIINGFFGRRPGVAKGLVSTVAVGTVAASFLLALYCFTILVFAEDGHPSAITYDLYRWFSIYVGETEIPVNVRFTMDHLSGIMTVMVTGIASLIHLYSTEYMGEDPSYPRFMTYLNLFTASMLILVLGSSLPVMFVGWEGVGLCSYLLIGFWWENPAYAAAGRKAFVVNRIGDFGVLIGIFLLVSAGHSFEFAELNASAVEYGQRQVELGGMPIGVTIAGAAAFFLFIGCTGKSAQLPLYVWLPDAMAGPTPVSALIHAATMVTAGVYLCCRLSPVFMMSESVMAMIAVVGAATALLGASIGVVQTQMKKILAYSTVSQLGFMFAAVGMGAFAAGIFHVFTHAFFKACLFLGAGSVMHAVHAHGDADIRWLGGMKKFMPKTRATFLISCLAIAGFPLTSGFFSKDEILFGALEGVPHLGYVGYVVFGMLAVAAFLTAFYMFRLYFLTFEGEFRGGSAPDAAAADPHGHGDDHHAEPHESGDAVTIPLMVLAAGALVVGFLGLPHWLGDVIHVHWNLWTPWLAGHEGEHGVIAHWAAGEHEGALSPTLMGVIAMSVGTLVGLGGIWLAYQWYRNATDVLVERETAVVRIAVGIGGVLGIALSVMLGMEIAETTHTLPMIAMVLGLLVLGAMSVFAVFVAANPRVDTHAWAMDKWRVDELYGATVVRPLRGTAVVSANIDRIFVDGLLTWVPAQLSRAGGWALTRMQNGVIYAYTIALVAGVAGLVWWFSYPHSQLVGEATDATVVWTADRGPGYEYRWDLDSDGDWDRDWSTEHTITHEYGQNDAFYGLVAILEAGALDVDPIEIPLSADPVSVPIDRIPADWARPPGEGETAVRDPSPPAIFVEGGEVVLRTNDAMVRGGTQTDEDREAGVIRLSPGDTARIGIAGLRIAVRVRATVQIRNAFGNFTRVREELTLRVPHTELEPIARTAR